VPGEDRVDQLGNDGVVVAHDAGEQRLPGAQFADQVLTYLVLDGSPRHSTGLDAGAQVSEGRGAIGAGHDGSSHARNRTSSSLGGGGAPGGVRAPRGRRPGTREYLCGVRTGRRGGGGRPRVGRPPGARRGSRGVSRSDTGQDDRRDRPGVRVVVPGAGRRRCGVPVHDR